MIKHKNKNKASSTSAVATASSYRHAMLLTQHSLPHGSFILWTFNKYLLHAMKIQIIRHAVPPLGSMQSHEKMDIEHFHQVTVADKHKDHGNGGRAAVLGTLARL